MYGIRARHDQDFVYRQAFRGQRQHSCRTRVYACVGAYVKVGDPRQLQLRAAHQPWSMNHISHSRCASATDPTPAWPRVEDEILEASG